MIFESNLEQQKIKKIQLIRELGLNPYDNATSNDTKIGEFLELNRNVASLPQQRDENKNYIINGRIKFYRLMGKASFIKIQDESGLLQVYVSRDNLPDGFYNNTVKEQ